MIDLRLGDCREVLASLPEASIDACVTDPPYHLTSIVKRFGGANAAQAQYGTDGAYRRASAGFMGKTWDGGSIAQDPATWAAVYRVLKPGAHLVAFSGTRTYHRMVCAIEDAGFEVRDQLAWVYGSGFPKSHDVSRALDRAAGVERANGGRLWAGGARSAGISHGGAQSGTANRIIYDEPATDLARQWQGWGTALKPAWEPICLARKPLVGTVAANVATHGTGAINVDKCRIETSDNLNGDAYSPGARSAPAAGRVAAVDGRLEGQFVQPSGRWPANLVHDGSDEVLACFPQSKPTGGQASLGAFRGGRVYGDGRDEREARDPGYGDAGSAARFFYCAKASKADRGEDNKHPTVKPTALMAWLCRLVTPPGGVVLDPFAGSGSTGKAAAQEGFCFIGIELEAESFATARKRLGIEIDVFT